MLDEWVKIIPGPSPDMFPMEKSLPSLIPWRKFGKKPLAEFGIEKQFDTLEKALEKTRFDAVIITTPTPTHLPLTALAAEHKKHVFLEKPMALNLEECDEINQVTEQARSPSATWLYASI